MASGARKRGVGTKFGTCPYLPWVRAPRGPGFAVQGVPGEAGERQERTDGPSVGRVHWRTTRVNLSNDYLPSKGG